MLSVENLKVVYRGVILALDGVSLEVGEGEAVALLGPNGAGKSSLVRAIAGLLPKFEGRVLDGKVRLFGREATHLDPVGISQMGLTAILEGRPLFRYLTPVENLMAAGHRLPPKALKEGMEEVFARFPRLYERRHEQAGYLSGGRVDKALRLGVPLRPACCLDHTLVPEGALAVYEMRVSEWPWDGDHALFMGEVVHVEGSAEAKERPILFLGFRDFATLGERWRFRPGGAKPLPREERGKP